MLLGCVNLQKKEHRMNSGSHGLGVCLILGSCIQDEDWGAAADVEGSGSKRRREPSGVEPEDSRAERRGRSHREHSGRRQRAEGAEEGLATAAVECAEAQQPRSSKDPHSRREKEGKAHRSDKYGA